MRKHTLFIAKMALATFLFLGTSCVNQTEKKNDDSISSPKDTTIFNIDTTVHDTQEEIKSIANDESTQTQKERRDKRFTTDKSIVGTWCNVKGGEMYKFKSNHTGVFSAGYVSSKFKWEKSGDEIILNHYDGGKTVLEINNGMLEEWSDLFNTTFIFQKMAE